jgi:hypothetical protein
VNRLLWTASLAAALLLAHSLPGRAEGDVDARKRALALQVMEVTGVTSQGKQFAEGQLAPIRPYFPTVPAETWEEVGQAFDVDQIVELSIPIYMRNFDEKELEQLVAFYKSPLGEKVIERMPLVMQESMVVVENWRQQKLVQVVEQLRSKGYEPVDPEPHPAPPSAPPVPE